MVVMAMVMVMVIVMIGVEGVIVMVMIAKVVGDGDGGDHTKDHQLSPVLEGGAGGMRIVGKNWSSKKNMVSELEAHSQATMHSTILTSEKQLATMAKSGLSEI